MFAQNTLYIVVFPKYPIPKMPPPYLFRFPWRLERLGGDGGQKDDSLEHQAMRKEMGCSGQP
jgi:hypothetical protein